MSMPLSTFAVRDNRRLAILLGALLVIYLVSRLLLLTRLPPFIDEGLHSFYVRTMESGIISAGAGDGKWLSIFIFYGLTRLPVDMLLVIRLASVAGGALTLVAIFMTGRELFSAAVGLLSAGFYIFLPYALFYNRLGLTDGIAVAFGAWVLYISVRAVRADKGGYTVLLTALLLACVLAKASAMLFILFPLLALVILVQRGAWPVALRKILPAIIGASVIVILMLSQDIGTAEIIHKTAETRSAGIIDLAANNTLTAGGWFWSLLTPPMAILSVVALLSLSIWRRDRAVLFVMAVLAVALVPYIVSAATWYPRYLLFALVPLTLLLAVFWAWLTDLLVQVTASPRRGRALSVLILALLLIWPALYGLRLMAAPQEARLPVIVRRLYVSDWTAGYGAKELAKYLEAQAQTTQGGLLVLRPDHLSQVTHGGLELFLQGEQPLMLQAIGRDFDTEVQGALAGLSAGQRTLFVFDSTNQSSQELAELVRRHAEVTQIWRNVKPQATGGLEVWELSSTIDY